MRPEKTEKNHRHRNRKTYSFTYSYKNQRYPRCGMRSVFYRIRKQHLPLPPFKHETTVLRTGHKRMEKAWFSNAVLFLLRAIRLSFEPSIAVKVVKSQLFQSNRRTRMERSNCIRAEKEFFFKFVNIGADQCIVGFSIRCIQRSVLGKQRLLHVDEPSQWAPITSYND